MRVYKKTAVNVGLSIIEKLKKEGVPTPVWIALAPVRDISLSNNFYGTEVMAICESVDVDREYKLSFYFIPVYKINKDGSITVNDALELVSFELAKLLSVSGLVNRMWRNINRQISSLEVSAVVLAENGVKAKAQWERYRLLLLEEFKNRLQNQYGTFIHEIS